MTMSFDQVPSITAEFREIVDGIYGTFLDAHNGFGQVRESMLQLEKESKEHFEQSQKERPDMAYLEYGGIEFSYGRFVPAGSPPRYRHMHQTPIEVILQRNEARGTNFRFIGNMCLVTLYQYWEDNYRNRFADALNVHKDQIQVDIFEAIRQYRRAIIHNGGKATSSLEKSSLFKWYKKGDQILLDRRQFEEVIDAIFEFLNTFEKRPKQFLRQSR